MKGKKISAILLTVILALAMVPAQVMANGGSGGYTLTLYPEYPGSSDDHEVISWNDNEYPLPEYENRTWKEVTYVHTGWSNLRDPGSGGEGTFYQPGETITLVPNLTLFARWDKLELISDGLLYSENAGGETVTLRGLSSTYVPKSGEGLKIPSEVEIKGKKYTVTAIGNGAFKDCKDITGPLVLPGTITRIGLKAFYNCSGFTGDLTIPEGVEQIEKSAFEGCRGFTGNLTISKGVTTIGERAFYGCSGFRGNLTIPGSVTEIEKNAFNGCSGLTGNLTIPDKVTTIGPYAFNGCSGFRGNLTIPGSVTKIGEYAFRGCSGFTGGLTIPDSVTTIGESAFYGCSGFKGDLTIPDKVTTIERNAFNGCSGFKGNLTIPSSVTAIGWGAFNGCSGFTGNLTIPDKVTTIGAFTFNGCSGFTGNLTIPDKVTTIERNAFNGCSGFTENLTIPDSVITLSLYAFSNTFFATITNNSNKPILCANIISDSDLYFYCDENGEKVTTINNGTYTLVCEKMADASVTVDPSSCTYSGTECKPEVTLTLGGRRLISGTDYTLTYSNNVNAGTATVTATGKGVYKGTLSRTFTIAKADQSINTASTSFTATYGDAPFSLKASASGGGSLTYTSGNTGVVTVDSKGTVTIKGTGTTTVRIDAAGTANYKAASKTVNVTVKAKPAPVKVYKVTASTDGNGTASASPMSGAAGTKVTITAKAKTGYKFKKWTVVSGRVKLADSTKASTSFTIKSSDVKVKAVFAKTEKISIKSAKIELAQKNLIYNGKRQKVSVKSVTLNNKVLDPGTDYSVSFSPASIQKVGKYKVKIKGKGNYTGEKSLTFEVKKAENPLTVKLAKSTLKISYSKLQKGRQTIKRSGYLNVSKAQGKVSYKKTSGNNRIAINGKTGNITVNKGLKKGTYKVNVKVSAAGNKNYKSGSRTLTVTVIVE